MSYEIRNSIRNSSASFMISPLGNSVCHTETSLLIFSEIFGTSCLYFFNPSNFGKAAGKSRERTEVPFLGVNMIFCPRDNLNFLTHDKNGSDTSKNLQKWLLLCLRLKKQKLMLNLRPRVVVCEYLMKICQNQNRESGK